MATWWHLFQVSLRVGLVFGLYFLGWTCLPEASSSDAWKCIGSAEKTRFALSYRKWSSAFGWMTIFFGLWWRLLTLEAAKDLQFISNLAVREAIQSRKAQSSSIRNNHALGNLAHYVDGTSCHSLAVGLRWLVWFCSVTRCFPIWECFWDKTFQTAKPRSGWCPITSENIVASTFSSLVQPPAPLRLTDIHRWEILATTAGLEQSIRSEPWLWFGFTSCYGWGSSKQDRASASWLEHQKQVYRKIKRRQGDISRRTKVFWMGDLKCNTEHVIMLSRATCETISVQS